MQEIRTDSEFHLVVTGTRRDGRRRYDEDSKQALVMACLQPGVSLAGMALKHGVNANLLRKWVVSHQLVAGAPAMPVADRIDAFVPVRLSNGDAGRIAQCMPVPIQPAAAAPPLTTTMKVPPARLRAQMPNGVTFEFECAGSDAALMVTVIETLGRCDVSSGR
jgi:transposase